jgi:hypothetical protein
MSRATVAWEGRPTLDRRIIEIDALTPKADRLPIYYSFSYTTILGWAYEFGRYLNPETGWGELSFELSFLQDWEQKIRDYRLNPTIGMRAAVRRVTPYDKPEVIASELEVITSGDIDCVSFGSGCDAWGEKSLW